MVDFWNLFYGAWAYDDNVTESMPDGFFFQTCDDSLDFRTIEKYAPGAKAFCMIVANETQLKYGGDFLDILNGHTPRSFFHKPGISVVIRENAARFFYESFFRFKSRVKVRIISDGKHAFLKAII